MIRLTLYCIRPTQSSVIQIIHRDVGVFFFIYQSVICYYRYIRIFHLYFTK